jgi:hypothetical protein
MFGILSLKLKGFYKPRACNRPGLADWDYRGWGAEPARKLPHRAGDVICKCVGDMPSCWVKLEVVLP